MKEFICKSPLGCNNRLETNEHVIMLQCACGYPMEEIQKKEENEKHNTK
jgi:hypothetical protein